MPGIWLRTRGKRVRTQGPATPHLREGQGLALAEKLSHRHPSSGRAAWEEQEAEAWEAGRLRRALRAQLVQGCVLCWHPFPGSRRLLRKHGAGLQNASSRSGCRRVPRGVPRGVSRNPDPAEVPGLQSRAQGRPVRGPPPPHHPSSRGLAATFLDKPLGRRALWEGEELPCFPQK